MAHYTTECAGGMTIPLYFGPSCLLLSRFTLTLSEDTQSFVFPPFLLNFETVPISSSGGGTNGVTHLSFIIGP